MKTLRELTTVCQIKAVVGDQASGHPISSASNVVQCLRLRDAESVRRGSEAASSEALVPRNHPEQEKLTCRR